MILANFIFSLLNLNLLDVVALAGGWTELADETDVVLTRIVGSENAEERQEFRYDLSELTQVDGKRLGLQQGDIIFVPSSSAMTFDDVLRYVTSLLVIVTAAVTISNN